MMAPMIKKTKNPAITFPKKDPMLPKKDFFFGLYDE